MDWGDDIFHWSGSSRPHPAQPWTLLVMGYPVIGSHHPQGKNCFPASHLNLSPFGLKPLPLELSLQALVKRHLTLTLLSHGYNIFLPVSSIFLWYSHTSTIQSCSTQVTNTSTQYGPPWKATLLSVPVKLQLLVSPKAKGSNVFWVSIVMFIPWPKRWGESALG